MASTIFSIVAFSASLYTSTFKSLAIFDVTGPIEITLEFLILSKFSSPIISTKFYTVEELANVI